MTRGLWISVLWFFFGAAHAEGDLFALQNITLVDLHNGELHTGQTVVWERSRIVSAGPSASVRVPPQTKVIQGEGRYLIPGLSDMHVHVREDSLSDFIA